MPIWMTGTQNWHFSRGRSLFWISCPLLQSLQSGLVVSIIYLLRTFRASQALFSMRTRSWRALHFIPKLRCTPSPNRRDLSQAAPSFTEGTISKVDSKAFSMTLLLPKTSFPLRSDPSKSEFQRKTCQDLYKWQVCVIFDSYHHGPADFIVFFDSHEVVGKC
jgi:hypothetical protein